MGKNIVLAGPFEVWSCPSPDLICHMTAHAYSSSPSDNIFDRRVFLLEEKCGKIFRFF